MTLDKEKRQQQTGQHLSQHILFVALSWMEKTPQNPCKSQKDCGLKAYWHSSTVLHSHAKMRPSTKANFLPLRDRTGR